MTFTSTTKTEELAAKIASGELIAGGIIAEFANGHDAAAFARSKGDGYTVTPGINLVFAVRPWITAEEQPNPKITPSITELNARFSIRVESVKQEHVTVRLFANGASCGLLTMRQHEVYALTVRLDAEILK